MSKLTLSVDARVVSRAKRYAKEKGTSVSALVEAYLANVAASPSEPATNLPVLRSARGLLKKADLRDYGRHLARKYR